MLEMQTAHRRKLVPVVLDTGTGSVPSDTTSALFFLRAPPRRLLDYLSVTKATNLGIHKRLPLGFAGLGPWLPRKGRDALSKCLNTDLPARLDHTIAFVWLLCSYDTTHCSENPTPQNDYALSLPQMRTPSRLRTGGAGYKT